MANGNGFKMGRWGWAGVTFVLGLATFWALTGFKNPFAGWGSVSEPKTGDICKTDTNQNGTIQADGTCKA